MTRPPHPNAGISVCETLDVEFARFELLYRDWEGELVQRVPLLNLPVTAIAARQAIHFLAASITATINSGVSPQYCHDLLQRFAELCPRDAQIELPESRELAFFAYESPQPSYAWVNATNCLLITPGFSAQYLHPSEVWRASLAADDHWLDD